MSPEAQRIAIAKALGFEGILSSSDHEGMLGKRHIDRKWATIPDYLNDLNAIHEAEGSLDASHHAQFREWLMHVVASTAGGLPSDFDRAYVSATASQRCEAFLRTIGKWREDAHA